MINNETIAQILTTLNKAITSEIGKQEDLLWESNVQFFGIAEVVEKDNKRFPVINEKGDGRAIMPDDTYKFQIYHVLNGDVLSDFNDEESFGFSECYDIQVPMKMVCLGRLREVRLDFNQGNEGMALAFLKSFPTRLTDSSMEDATQCCEFRINAKLANTDKERILNEQFRNVDLESYLLDICCFEISYNLNFQFFKKQSILNIQDYAD